MQKAEASNARGNTWLALQDREHADRADIAINWRATVADAKVAAVALTSGRFRDNAQLQAAAQNAPALAVGAQGEHVQILQRALDDLGFAMPISAPRNAVLPDGIYGQETAGTVRKFQQREGLGVDGVAGRQTLTRLDEIFIALAAREEIALRSQLPGLFWT